jgi:alkylated DNA repair dioxygenase AlkB
VPLARALTSRYLSCSMRAGSLIRQPSLFGAGAPQVDVSFGAMKRIELEHGAFIDLCPQWLRGESALFERLLEGADWREEERVMYERVVDVPRLCATPTSLAALHPVLSVMGRALDQRYRTEFERVSLALYRDGRDSVAWHGDYVARRMPEAVVATVSVGAPRRFLLRPTGGGKSLSLSLGAGDLLVMGGTCQRTYQHAIPKVTRALPRIAIMYRPVWIE